MRFVPRALVAGGVGFAVSCLAACGGGAGLLSGDQSGTLSSRLDQISSSLQSGNCGTVTRASASLSNDVVNLPSTVNSTLRADLAQGASTVSELAQRQCHPATKPSTTTATTTPTTAPTTTATTPTTPTTTPQTTTGTAPATTPTTPGTTSTTPSGGGGLSGGGGTTTGAGGAGTSGNGNGQ